MQRIKLIGLPTKRYSEIEQSLLSFFKIKNIEALIIKENDINIFLEDSISSIPAVVYSGIIVFVHPDRQIEKELAQVFESLVNNVKSDKCKNCGNCKCKNLLSEKNFTSFPHVHSAYQESVS